MYVAKPRNVRVKQVSKLKRVSTVGHATTLNETSIVPGACSHRVQSTMNVDFHRARQFWHLGRGSTSQMVAAIAALYWFRAVKIHRRAIRARALPPVAPTDH